MGNSKIIYNGNTLIDLTSDTVDADHLAQGYTAHDKAGNEIIGVMAIAGIGYETGQFNSGSTGGTTVTLGHKPLYFIVSSHDIVGGTYYPSGCFDFTKGHNATFTCSAFNGGEFVQYIGNLNGNSIEISVLGYDDRPLYNNITYYTAVYSTDGSSTPSEPVLQSKTVDITTNGTTTINPDSGYDGLNEVVINTNVPISSGNSKNVQAYHGYKTVSATSYSSTGVRLTVDKTGTYKVSWMGYRNTNSGTSGSQLYINNSSYGSANTSFVNTYGHSVTLNNVSLTEGQTIEVRARSRSTSYVMAVGNLIIEEV